MGTLTKRPLNKTLIGSFNCGCITEVSIVHVYISTTLIDTDLNHYV